MNIFNAGRGKTLFGDTGSRASKEFPVFTGILSFAVILNCILLIVFGGWWIFFFPIALLPHLLFMFSSFYIKLSKISGIIRKLLLGSAIYGVIFPLIYLPAILDSTDYEYILFGLRPSHDSWISQLILNSSAYAWPLLGVSATIVLIGVIYISIVRRRDSRNLKKAKKT